MNHPDPLDLVALLIALLALIASKEIANLVGPYAAIIVLASAGAALSLSGNDIVMSIPRACWYIGIRVLIAVSLTVGIAEILQLSGADWLKPRYTLIPLAFGIGWIRDYNKVLKWIGSLIPRIVERALQAVPPRKD